MLGYIPCCLNMNALSYNLPLHRACVAIPENCRCESFSMFVRGSLEINLLTSGYVLWLPN